MINKNAIKKDEIRHHSCRYNCVSRPAGDWILQTPAHTHTHMRIWHASSFNSCVSPKKKNLFNIDGRRQLFRYELSLRFGLYISHRISTSSRLTHIAHLSHNGNFIKTCVICYTSYSTTLNLSSYVTTIHTELPTRSSLKSSVLLLAQVRQIKSAHQESMRVKLSLGFSSMIQTSTSQWTHEKTTTIIRLLDKYFSAKENNNNTSETKNTIDIVYNVPFTVSI